MRVFQVEIVDDNPFNAGWVAYVLGLPRPTERWAAEGWDTGAETASLADVRYVFEAQNGLEKPQYRVTAT
jgi:hypothetical protein